MEGNARKLLFFIGDFAGGGTQRYLLQLLEGLDRRRFDPTVACFEPEGELRASVSALARIAPFPLRGHLFDRHGLATLLRFSRWLRAERFHVVNTLSDRANVFGLIGCALARPPAVIASQRGFDPVSDSFVTARPALVALSHMLFRRVPDFVTVNNPLIAEHLASRVRVSASRIRLIENGVDTERFAPRPPDPELAERLGTRGRLTIGIVGRISPGKGHATMLDVIEGYPASHRPLLLALGDGPLRPEFEAAVKARGLSDSVRCLGFVPDPSHFYNLLDVFCLPTTAAEGTPNALIEALASSIPSVVSDLPQLRRFVRRNEQVGQSEVDEPVLFADAACPEGIRRALERLRTEDDLRARMKTLSRELAVERHGLRAMIERTQSVYEEALARRTA